MKAVSDDFSFFFVTILSMSVLSIKWYIGIDKVTGFLQLKFYKAYLL